MDLARVSAFVLDVGSTITNKKTKRTGFGWARATAAGLQGNQDIDDCCQTISDDVVAGRHVAIGFESPTFIPVPGDSGGLSRGRNGEGNRSCFAPAGATVATLGIHQALFVLGGLPACKVTVRWKGWLQDPTPVLLWEAFVSGDAHTKTGDHVADAGTAAREFLARIETEDLTTDVTVEPPRGLFSMIGAAVLWAQLDTDVGLLKEPVFVLKPKAASAASVMPFTRPRPAR